MAKKYRIAIIGVGAIGQLHAKAIGDLKNAQVVAGSHVAAEPVAAFAKQYNCKGYTDYEKMLDEVKPDLATICTPSGVHLEPALARFKRRIHVLCEKPLEITTARIDQMLAAATSGGVILGGIFPQRFNPVMQAVRQAAAEGRFGDLAAVSAAVPWWRDDAYYGPGRWQGTLKFDGGGALMNQSIHHVDMLQWVAAAALKLDPAVNPVEQVFAFTAKRAHDPKRLEVEDTAVGIVRFRGGALGQLMGTTSLFPGSLKRFLIGGRDGTAEVLEDQLVSFGFRNVRPEDEQLEQKFGPTRHGGGAADPMSINYGLHTANIAAFLEALDSGQRPTIDGRESRKAVAIIEAIYESACSGRAVDLK